MARRRFLHWCRATEARPSASVPNVSFCAGAVTFHVAGEAGTLHRFQNPASRALKTMTPRSWAHAAGEPTSRSRRAADRSWRKNPPITPPAQVIVSYPDRLMVVRWRGTTSTMPLVVIGLLFLLTRACAEGQLPQPDVPIDEPVRAAVLKSLALKVAAGYVLPDRGEIAAQRLRAAAASGDYDALTSARRFAESVTSDLRAITHDKHIALYFDPEGKQPNASIRSPAGGRERFNFGFNKLERLKGNVGYLELRSFANLDEAKETASTFLSALANFDSIILDLRQNGGGHTPMIAHIASYFLGPQPVHLTSIYWRDENRTIEVLTSETVTGHRSLDRDLFILIGPSTFSAAEDFCYALQQLQRASLVGERTGGGAHMGRGLQRLSPLFTAFVPTGKSINPISKSNWENSGVKPDVEVPSGKALQAAHVLALRKLLEHERDPKWQENLRRALIEVANEK
jgi:retinol-binding protein 3